MGLTLQTSPAMAGSVVDELRAAGVSYEDVQIALAYQDAQRRGGVPVLPLRVICGLDKPQARADRVMLENTRALLMVPRRGGRPQGGLHITRRKIWANSVKTESPEEADFHRPLGTPQRTRLYRAKRSLFKLAQKLAHDARQKLRVLSEQELLVAQFTQSCERVLHHLLWEERGRKGWLTPDYETIMEWTGLSRSTVYRTLNLLKEIGLIEWIRRFNYSRDSQSGARSEQTSNLYRLTLPIWLEKMLGMHTPMPADEEHRRQLALEDHATMLAVVSPQERGRLLPDDPAIRADLASAALRLDQRARAVLATRECHKNIAPLMNYIFSKNGEKESAWSADAYSPDGLDLA
jgi:DNA-binding transcriptional ArsR family regulator